MNPNSALNLILLGVFLGAGAMYVAATLDQRESASWRRMDQLREEFADLAAKLQPKAPEAAA